MCRYLKFIIYYDEIEISVTEFEISLIIERSFCLNILIFCFKNLLWICFINWFWCCFVMFLIEDKRLELSKEVEKKTSLHQQFLFFQILKEYCKKIAIFVYIFHSVSFFLNKQNTIHYIGYSSILALSSYFCSFNIRYVKSFSTFDIFLFSQVFMSLFQKLKDLI